MRDRDVWMYWVLPLDYSSHPSSSPDAVLLSWVDAYPRTTQSWSRHNVLINLIQRIFLVWVQLKTEVLHIPSLTRPGFEPMTSRSWQYISCPWDVHSNHLDIRDFLICLPDEKDNSRRVFSHHCSHKITYSDRQVTKSNFLYHTIFYKAWDK